MTPAPVPTRRTPEQTDEQAPGRARPWGAGRSPGWTLGLLDVLGPYLRGRPRDAHDLLRFGDLPWTAAAQLLQRLPPEQLAGRQNAAPSLGSLLVAAVAHPREVELHGYLVPPARSDERVAAEGLVVYDHPELDGFRIADPGTPCEEGGCECAALWSCVQASFGLDDAERGPDLVVPRPCPRTGRPGWYLWWD